MTNPFKSVLCLALACFLLVFSLHTVSAETHPDDTVILGTESENTGILFDNESNRSNTRAGFSPIIKDDGTGSMYTLLFSITAAEVYELLVSNRGGKSFSISDFPANAQYIRCTATVEHSLADQVNIVNEFVRAGICYYEYDSTYDEGVYVSVATLYFGEEDLGRPMERRFLISDVIEYGVFYYSYVKNCYPGGYVTGTVTLDYSPI